MNASRSRPYAFTVWGETSRSFSRCSRYSATSRLGIEFLNNSPQRHRGHRGTLLEANGSRYIAMATFDRSKEQHQVPYFVGMSRCRACFEC